MPEGLGGEAGRPPQMIVEESPPSTDKQSSCGDDGDPSSTEEEEQDLRSGRPPAAARDPKSAAKKKIREDSPRTGRGMSPSVEDHEGEWATSKKTQGYEERDTKKSKFAAAKEHASSRVPRANEGANQSHGGAEEYVDELEEEEYVIPG